MCQQTKHAMTLMIQHVAHKTRFYRAKLSPRVGEHICSLISMLGAVGVGFCLY